jgi:hypothetical protein
LIARPAPLTLSSPVGDLARKGQELREMTRDLDLLRADVDVIAMVVRLRGAFAPGDARTEESPDGENKEESA